MQKVQNENTTPITVDKERQKIRLAIDTYYDLQKVRIAIGNRLVAAFGIDISEESTIDPETGEESNEERKNVLKEIEGEYDSINKKLKERPGTRVSTVINKDPSLKYIKQQSYYKLVSSYMNAKEAEDATEDYVKEQVHNHYLWDMFFKDMVGCGEFLAGMLIAYLDVHKARHVSCFWSYAGLGCRFSEKTGKYEAQSKHNLTTRKYIDKNDGKEKECQSLGYNPVLHMWLLGRLPSNVFRAASRSNKHCELIECYRDYYNRYENRADNQEKPSKARCMRRASRAMAKYLLRELWCVWREAEGYTLSVPYEVEYLGRAPHKYNEAHSRMAAGE